MLSIKSGMSEKDKLSINPNADKSETWPWTQSDKLPEGYDNLWVCECDKALTAFFYILLGA